MKTKRSTLFALPGMLIIALGFLFQANVANAINLGPDCPADATEPCICILPYCVKDYNTLLPHPVVHALRVEINRAYDKARQRQENRHERRQDRRETRQQRREDRRAARQARRDSTTSILFTMPAYVNEQSPASYVPLFNDINYQEILGVPLALTRADGTLNIAPTVVYHDDDHVTTGTTEHGLDAGGAIILTSDDPGFECPSDDEMICSLLEMVMGLFKKAPTMPEPIKSMNTSDGWPASEPLVIAFENSVGPNPGVGLKERSAKRAITLYKQTSPANAPGDPEFTELSDNDYDIEVGTGAARRLFAKANTLELVITPKETWENNTTYLVAVTDKLQDSEDHAVDTSDSYFNMATCDLAQTTTTADDYCVYPEISSTVQDVEDWLVTQGGVKNDIIYSSLFTIGSAGKEIETIASAVAKANAGGTSAVWTQCVGKNCTTAGDLFRLTLDRWDGPFGCPLVGKPGDVVGMPQDGKCPELNFLEAIATDADIGLVERHELTKAYKRGRSKRDAEKINVSSGWLKLPLFAHMRVNELFSPQPYLTESIKGTSTSLYSLYEALGQTVAVPGAPGSNQGFVTTQLQALGIEDSQILDIAAGEFSGITFDTILKLSNQNIKVYCESQGVAQLCKNGQTSLDPELNLTQYSPLPALYDIATVPFRLFAPQGTEKTSVTIFVHDLGSSKTTAYDFAVNYITKSVHDKKPMSIIAIDQVFSGSRAPGTWGEGFAHFEGFPALQGINQWTLEDLGIEELNIPIVKDLKLSELVPQLQEVAKAGECPHALRNVCRAMGFADYSSADQVDLGPLGIFSGLLPADTIPEIAKNPLATMFLGTGTCSYTGSGDPTEMPDEEAACNAAADVNGSCSTDIPSGENNAASCNAQSYCDCTEPLKKNNVACVPDAPKSLCQAQKTGFLNKADGNGGTWVQAQWTAYYTWSPEFTGREGCEQLCPMVTNNLQAAPPACGDTNKNAVKDYITAGYDATCEALITDIPKGLANVLIPGSYLNLRRPSVGAGNILQGVGDLFGLRIALNHAGEAIGSFTPGQVSVFGHGLGAAIAADYAVYNQKQIDNAYPFKAIAISLASPPAGIVPVMLESPVLSLSQASTVVENSETYQEWADGPGDCPMDISIPTIMELIENEEWVELVLGGIKEIGGKATCLARYRLTHAQDYENDIRRFTMQAQTAYTSVDPASLIRQIPDDQFLLVMLNQYNFRYPLNLTHNAIAGSKPVVDADDSLDYLTKTSNCTRARNCHGRRIALYRWGGNETIIDTLSNLIGFTSNVGPLRSVRDSMTLQNRSFIISGGKKIDVKLTQRPLLKRR